MVIRGAAVLAGWAGTLALACAAGPGWAQGTDTQPLSAIDWLSQSVQTPASATGPAPINEPPVAQTAETPEITMTPLDTPSPDRAGLLAPAVTGLPRTLWSASATETLTTLIRAERVETLPAIQELMVTLMLAHADPPLGAGPDGATRPAGIGRFIVRVINASMSRSYHMLMAPEAPAPTAMHSTAMAARNGCSAPGAR